MHWIVKETILSYKNIKNCDSVIYMCFLVSTSSNKIYLSKFWSGDGYKWYFEMPEAVLTAVQMYVIFVSYKVQS